MRHTTTVLIALAVSLSACSGTDDEAPPPEPSPSTAATTTASAPTPPAMPRAAEAHTRAGAKAFVEYFWKVVDYAQATGDTARIAALTDGSGCPQCRAGIRSIKRVYDAGGVIHGGTSTPTNLRARLFAVHGSDFATVDYDISVAPARFDYADDTQDNSDPATTGTRRARLVADEGSSWRVVELRGLS
jgi:hypothetical protein